MEQLRIFDYQQLDTETRIVVQQRTGEIKALMKRTAQDIIEIGEKLIEVKKRLEHGNFGPWLEAEFNWSQMTATKYMNIARKFKGTLILENSSIGIEALALLAAPSTPDEARQEAIDRAQNGETITHSLAKEITSNHKIAPPGNGYLPTENRMEFDYDSHLDAALTDESKPVCPECGQIYEGESCPDCTPRNYYTGGLAHCKYCYKTHGDWRLSVDHLASWECLSCHHFIADEFMDIREGSDFNYLRDNRKSTPSDIYTPQGMDACQTPAYAIDPLLPYLPKNWAIWEPAAGEGNLVEALFDSGFKSVAASDILTDQNFFEFEPDEWDCIVTNPPFSIQAKWLERCYQLGQPFALLLKVDVLGNKGSQELFDRHGIEIILLNKRVNFKMPIKGWDSHAQFATAWFTYGLNIGRQLTFGKIETNGTTDPDDSIL